MARSPKCRPDLVHGSVPLPLDVGPGPLGKFLRLLAGASHFLFPETFRSLPGLVQQTLALAAGLVELLLDGRAGTWLLLPGPVGGGQAFPDSLSTDWSMAR